MNSVERDACPPGEGQGHLPQLARSQDIVRRLVVSSSGKLGLPLLLGKGSAGIVRVPLASPQGAGRT